MPVDRGARRYAGRAAATLAVLLGAWLFAAGAAVAAPGDWTLTKTPTPTTYTAVGQVIDYAYHITNVRGSNGHFTAFTDDKVTSISCPSNVVPPAGLDCTGSYTIQQADLDAGSVFNTATVTGDSCNDGCTVTATATATVRFIPRPSWNLAKTPDPTTYGAAGETVVYSYVLTNTGNVPITAISLGDDKVSGISCPAAALIAGASMTCTGSYLTTAADVTAGSVTNHATASGTPSGGSLPDATAQATITFVGTASWTLAKTPTPTTYSAAGQSIAYTYLLKNTGSVSISAIALADDRIGSLSCPGTTLGAGASMTCTGSYVTTVADVSAGSVTNHATASGTPAGGTLANATAQATITFVGAASLALVKTPTPTTYSAAGQVITYSYSVTNTGNTTITAAITVSDDKIASVSCPANPGLTPGASLSCTGIYVITASDISSGAVINTAVAHAGGVNSARASATVTAVTGPSAGIPPFLQDRVDAMLNDEPDRPQFDRRFTGTLWGAPDPGTDGGSSGQGGASAYAPVDFAAAGNGTGGGDVTVSTSLEQVLAYADRSDRGGVAGAAPLTPTGPQGPINLWTEEHFSFGDRQGGSFNFGSAYVGADFLAAPSVLIGALAEIDSTSASLTNINGKASGVGWMFGPYTSVHVAPNLYFDARLAWGQSFNTVSMTGGGSDGFDTDRILGRANLTGNFQSGNWRLTPSASIAYLSESQHAYTSSSGAAVPAYTVAVGRITAGPEIARRFVTGNGTVVEPMAGLTLAWDFAQTGVLSGAAALPELSAAATAAVMVTRPSGVTARAAVKYDGIGASDFQSYGGQFWLSVPLH